MGVLTKLYTENVSHPVFKWVAQIAPNITAVNELYREQYEETGKNMTICLPFVMGAQYPDWLTRDYIFGCVNYTPASVEHVFHLKDIGFVYKREKPMIDVFIGLGTVITTLGVPGEY